MTQFLQWKWAIAAPFVGMLLTFAFAPYDYGYIALPALAFFYGFCSSQSARKAALTGYLFGLGLYGAGIWWVYISIHDFGGADSVSAVLLVLLLVGLWAAFPALTAWLFAKFFSALNASSGAALFALLWVAVEYVRGYCLLNGFPWLQIAYSQLYTPFAGFAPLVGVYGIGFLLAWSGAISIEILRERIKPLLGAVFFLTIWIGGWYSSRIQWTHEVGEPIKITLVQGNIDQRQKWLPDQKFRTMKRYQQLTEQHWDSDVIIWPETAIPAFFVEVKDFFLAPLARSAREHGVDLVVSLPTDGALSEYYNSVMTLGSKQRFYHKNHLLPFGEYLPLQPLSGWILDRLQIPLGDFTAGGDRQTLLEAGGYPFVTTICYEDAFGELVSRQLEQAAYLVNVTNDAWFGNSAEPFQHMQMAQMRALETGRYMVRATNTGLTGFVMPNGRISQQAPLYTTMTLTGNVVPMGGLTPYARLGDRGTLAAVALLTLSLYVFDRYSRRRLRRWKLSVLKAD